MKFKKEILEGILVKTFQEYYDDNKKQEAFGKLFNIISPDTHLHYIEIDKTVAILKIIKIFNKDLEDWISYFMYEASIFWKEGKGVKITTKEGKEFNIMNQTEAIQFILNECDFIIKED